MNDKRGILIFILAASLSMLFGMKAFGAELNVKAVDEQGYPVRFNKENHALNAGNVIFYIESGGLGKDESICYDDGGIISTVEDGVYVMEAKEEGETAFVSFYISDQEGLKPVGSRPYEVEFTQKLEVQPDVRFFNPDKERYAYVEASPKNWVNTFLVIKDDSGTKRRHITEKTKITFSAEGVYEIYAYTVDGKGNRTYSKDLPQTLTVDETPPVTGDIVIDKPVSDTGSVVSGKKVTISVSAYDELSGLEGIYMLVDKKESVKGSTITVNPPFKGSISFVAKDNAGNETEPMVIVKELTVDDEPPKIEAKNEGYTGETVKLLLSASDDLSGVKKLRAVYDYKTVFENDGRKEEFILDVKNMGYEEQKLTIYAWDNAGNRSEETIHLQKTDIKPPKIAFYGASDKGVYGGDTEVYVEVSDDSGRLAAYSANVFVTDADGKMLYSSTTDSKSLKITQSGFVTLTAQAADYEGNTSKSAISFIVDKDAPVIRGVEEYDGLVLERFELKEDAGDMVEDLSCVTAEVYLNGLEYDGKPVTKEGKYVLKITARDEFGNTSVKEADFTVKADKEHEPEDGGIAAKQDVSGNLAVIQQRVSHNSVSRASVSAPAAYRKSVSSAAVSGGAVSYDSVSAQMRSEHGSGFFERVKYAIIELFNF